MSRFSVEDYLRYVEGELSARRAAELEAYVADNREVREQLDKARHLVEQLGADEPDLADARVNAAVWARIDGEVESRARRGTRWLGTLGLAVAAAACLITIAVLPDDQAPDASEWRVKSTATASLAGVDLYRRTADGTERVGPGIDPNDQLLVAYRNFEEPAYAHLMVFAVTPEGQVYWYYPAFVDAETDPSSIRIDRTESALQLPDAIRHALPPGRLAVFSLFSRTPYRVSEIEAIAAVGWRGESAKPLPISERDALQQVHQLQVR